MSGEESAYGRFLMQNGCTAEFRRKMRGNAAVKNSQDEYFNGDDGILSVLVDRLMFTITRGIDGRPLAFTEMMPLAGECARVAGLLNLLTVKVVSPGIMAGCNAGLADHSLYYLLVNITVCYNYVAAVRSPAAGIDVICCAHNMLSWCQALPCVKIRSEDSRLRRVRLARNAEAGAIVVCCA